MLGGVQETPENMLLSNRHRCRRDLVATRDDLCKITDLLENYVLLGQCTCRNHLWFTEQREAQ